MSSVLVDRQGGVMTMTLNRPDTQNSIVAEVYAELLAAMREAEGDDAVRVMVLRAAGRNFCVGADAGNLSGYSRRGLAQTFDEDFRGRIGLPAGMGGPMEALGIGAWVLAVAAIEKPIIAAVQGVAAGGGFALAMLPHFRVAATSARFTAAFAKLGLGCELGLSATLPAVCGMQKAMDIILSSRLVDAEEAHGIGIVDRLAAPEDLDATAQAFAEEIAAMAPLSVRASLRHLRRGWLADLREQLALEWQDQSVLFASEDFGEGVRAFVERRAPAFRGC